ncbi:MAG: class I SAM-dependent methyltransferase [Verrucomicrobiota bacterium]
MATGLEKRACPITGNQSAQSYKTIIDHYTGDEYQVVKCPETQFLYLDPAPDLEHIAEHYANHAGQNMTTKPPTLFNFFRRFAFQSECHTLLNNLKPNSKIIDLGTGDGQLARFFKESQLQAKGMDFFPESEWPHDDIPYSSINLNETSVLETLDTNAIVMRHVLEHVHYPLEMIKAFHTANIDYVMVVVPNVESPAVNWFGTDWCSWDPPRHLQFFSEKTLRELFQRAGYREIGKHDHGIDEIVVSFFRKKMIQWHQDPESRTCERPEEESWYPLLESKNSLCTLAAVLQGPFLPSVLSRTFQRV